ncbi:N-acetylglucosamine kinase [Streptomyces sp. NPDC005151]
MTALFLGLDVGGSRTRAVLVDADGREVGRSTHPGANAAVNGPSVVAARLVDAISAALTDAERRSAPDAERRSADIAGCVIGLSGYRALEESERAHIADACREASAPHCPVTLLPDAVIAFASGTAKPTGSVLIAGTGAIACRIDGHRVAATAGGLGWLLGDEGGGFWLGKEAIRRTAESLRRGTSAGPLAEAVFAAASLKEHSVEALLRWTYERPPQHLAALAPLLGPAAEAGDPLAMQLIADAARALADLVASVAIAGEPVVLAGSVATRSATVHDLLVAEIGVTREVLSGTDAALAAAHLALVRGPALLGQRC